MFIDDSNIALRSIPSAAFKKHKIIKYQIYSYCW